MKISVQSLWTAIHSQIYPALHKLEEEGLITGENQGRGQSLQRTGYTLTPAGEQELMSWLRQPIQFERGGKRKDRRY